MIKFTKQPKCNKCHIKTWQARGLNISKTDQRAEHYLNYISYYRLSAYTIPFQQPATDTSKPSTATPVLGHEVTR